MIFLIGSPRSGTTWVAKIFDSHPDVLYRHEPDSVVVTEEVPFFPKSEEIEKLIPATRDYFTRLWDVRQLKSAGSLPVFPKSYFSAFMNAFRAKFLFMLKVIGAVAHRLSLPSDVKVPAVSRRKMAKGKIVPVMKSVNSNCRTGLVARAFPEGKVVHILRHPCGYVSSQLRGRKLKLMENVVFYEEVAAMPLSKERGWTVEKLKEMSLEEQLACTWVSFNEKVMKDIEGLENCYDLVYEDLCDDPIGVTRKLYAFCGLSYNDQTDAFLQSSLNYSGSNEKYHQTVRDPKTAAEKWKKELDADQISKIRNIVSGTIAGDRFAARFD
ncbi:sulfotransferase [Emcibacter sp.]|uniref:sulfotransferase family protein n=1 Tax=Emcibacter sp. TaxID=1979954 RepID=UPI002AA6E5CE|nr:sulfotransferase [Emcibacter sp.]